MRLSTLVLASFVACIAIAPAAAQRLRIQTTSLPTATVGTPYSATLEASGGDRPYDWSIMLGSLPPGLSLNSRSGSISGTPSAAGRFNFVVRVSGGDRGDDDDDDDDDGGRRFAIAGLSITVNAALQPLAVTTASLPNGMAGQPYSAALSASGGAGPYQWSIASGSLPPGVALSGATIAGTPSTAGTFGFIVRVTDAAQNTATRQLSIAIGPPPIQILTSALPQGTVGTHYSHTLSASGGTPPYSWVVIGALPAGMALSGAAIAGTPTAAGTSTFTLQVSDGQSSANRQFSITIVAPALQILTSSLPDGAIGTPYSHSLAAGGGTPPYTWTVTGALPAGLALSGATITGTPTAAGTSTFTLRVSDANTSASRQLSITIAPPALQILTSSLPDGAIGTPYSHSLAAGGGTPPYAWTVTGALPAGLALSGATITGTPTAAGTSTFTLRVSDANTSASRQFSITVVGPALQITTDSFPQGAVGAAYSQTLTASGGTPPYSWTVSGALPAGLTLSGATVAGTPTAAGTSTFTIQVSDARTSVSRQFSITIAGPALRITTDSLPQGTAGEPYSHTLAAAGGAPPYTWNVSGGLPTGLALSGATIAGTPAAAGTFTFTVQVSDGHATASRQFSIAVGASALRITTASLSAGAVGVRYFQPLAASGGTPPYTWTITGAAPSGLAISGASITGNPSAPGAHPLTLRVSDSRANSATGEFTLTVHPAALIIVTSSLQQALVGAPYFHPLEAGGGTPPYTWSADSDLPPGLALANGALTGVPAMPGDFTFNLRVSDSAAVTASQTYTLRVGANLGIATPSLADGSIGTPYSQAVTASGGTLPYSWAVASGSLPEGLSLDGATGIVAGVPAAVGSYSFTLRVTDAGGVQASRTYAVQVAAGLVIATAPVLPQGASGAPYSQTLTAAGGRSPFTWSITAGALPAGLTLNPSNGAIAGTPAASGQFEFTVRATDAANTAATKRFTLSIAAPLVISSAPSLPDGGAGHAYSQPLSAAGGVPPFVWSIDSGALPAGLRLDPDTGVLSGKPAAAGSFTFTALVTDSLGSAARKQFALRIVPGLIITTGALADATLGGDYAQSLTAAGGARPYTWSLAAGALPPGLTLSPETGLISGSPTSGGSFSLTLRVTDASGLAATREHVLTVRMPALPAVEITGGADSLEPMQQPVIGVSLSGPYPTQITGRLTLAFEPDAAEPADDLAVQFATGGRVASFTIPANGEGANFSIPVMAFQTGTVAGTITLTATLHSGSAEITPPGGISRTMRIPRSVPKIRAATAVRTGSGFEVRITSLSPGRELVRAVVRLTPVPGSDLQTAEISVPLEEAAANWYRTPSARQFGSQFTLVMPFTVQGSIGSIETVTVTLVNQAGASEPAALKIVP